MYLSIIIPAYNEEKRLPATLLDIEECMKDFSELYEIIVMSDGSKDNTVEVAKALIPRVRNLKVIENIENHGKGWVTKQGLLIAKGEWRLFMDADNSTTMREFKKLEPFMREEFGAIIGSRGIRGAELHPPQPLLRRIPGKIGNLIIQFLVLPGIWDTQCGFKCFSASATEKIFPLMRVGKWGFDVEALALARKFGFRIKEVPILWRNDERSTLGAGAYVSTLLEVAKIRWWLWTGIYDGK